jgi:hypothetical protein
METIILSGSRNTRPAVNREFFTPEIREQIEEATGKDFGKLTPEQAQQAINEFFQSEEYQNQVSESQENTKEKENLWNKYKVPFILGGSLVFIGLLYWLLFIRKK